MNTLTVSALIALLLGAVLFVFLRVNTQFALPAGQATSLSEPEQKSAPSQRVISITDGTKHSIPIEDILSGGPGKDGIPSIDNPKFIGASQAQEFLETTDPGIGLVVKGEARFYPYRILVWHEIVNDTIGGQPVLVTYCPLCATGIVFERRVDGVAQEFGVSGKLWQSNLLMYNRATNESGESLWSQVLGEAVVGPDTGAKLAILPSDIVRWGEWKKLHADTTVLSRDTGTFRDYGKDPYGDYYTSESVSFGASFNDTRLHPKALVAGIEVNGSYKAYPIKTLPLGETTDVLAGKTIAITKNSSGQLTFTADGVSVPYIQSFWFSWLGVHPKTELFDGS